MNELAKGSKSDLASTSYRVTVSGPAVESVDVMAVMLDRAGRVRTDSDLVFFYNPQATGLALTSGQSIDVDLDALPADVERAVIAASTEAQHTHFGYLQGFTVGIAGSHDAFTFAPPALTTETVVQLVAFYRRNGRWRLDAIGQGYADGLASFARDFGIAVDDAPPATAPTALPPPAQSSAHTSPTSPQYPPTPSPPPPRPPTPRPTPTTTSSLAPPPPAPINMQKVSLTLTKDSPTKRASIDLRKDMGDPTWVLTVGLEWDGRGAVYAPDGGVKRYGSGDLDVYFYCRNEVTNDYVVISGERNRRGDLSVWPSSTTTATARAQERANDQQWNRFRFDPTKTATCSSTSTKASTTDSAPSTRSADHGASSATDRSAEARRRTKVRD